MNETVKKSVRLQKPNNGIAIVTLSRPDFANALSIQLLYDLHDILEDIKNDSSVRVVILTGSGEKAFCAGADLKERREMTDSEVKKTVRLIGSIVNEVEALPQPVIAALNGVAYGGGLELALACDLRIGAIEASVGLTETSLAIIPGAGGTQRLPRLIGLGKAKELIFTAKRLSAEEAEAIGLLEYVVPRIQLFDKAMELAAEYCQKCSSRINPSKNGN